MKRLFTIILSLFWLASIGQEIPPAGTKAATTNQGYIAPDSTYFLRIGAPGLTAFYTQMVRNKALKDSLVQQRNRFNAITPRVSAQVFPASLGVSTTVTIPELIGKYIDEVKIGGRGGWKVAVSANEANKTVSFNSASGTITFPVPIYDFVWAWYRNTLPSSVTSGGIIIVQNYSDIMSHSTWGGTSEQTYYVLTDFQNMNGKKGAYKYVPSFTQTPAQIAINFND